MEENGSLNTHNQGVAGSSPAGPTGEGEGVRLKRSDSFFCWIELCLKIGLGYPCIMFHLGKPSNEYNEL